MSSAVCDLAQAEFVGRRDDQNNPLPSIPPLDRTGYAVAEWTLRNVLSAGSLLGKSCQGTLKLAGHSDEIQEQGYQFGKHLALAWQVIIKYGDKRAVKISDIPQVELVSTHQRYAYRK